MDREITHLAAARQVNQDAFTEIFELYAPVLYKYAFRLCNHARMADQLVGKIFNRLVQQLSAGQNPDVNRRACLYQIAHNLLVRDARYTTYFVSPNWTGLTQRDRGSTDLSSDDKRGRPVASIVC